MCCDCLPYAKFTLIVLAIKIVSFFFLIQKKMITLGAMLHKLDEENVGKSTH